MDEAIEHFKAFAIDPSRLTARGQPGSLLKHAFGITRQASDRSAVLSPRPSAWSDATRTKEGTKLQAALSESGPRRSEARMAERGWGRGWPNTRSSSHSHRYSTR